ncbi:MAG: hypothetical protein JRI23_07985 [Deltaproteobacteria bacterium]|jgi:uncharacterized protein (TIGR03067 family)|nr:hypothetical protein [Deltaproteobacteria bacterium]MBW2531551.1 hypothetical protein [Deltaproteobacteria bacterium]
MKNRTLVPLLLAAVPWLAGCETSPKDRLQGRWVGQEVEHFAAEQARRASGWARGATFEFRGNRVTVGIPTERPRQGTYRITAASPDELRISFVRPHGPQDEATFRFDGDDVLRWMLGDGRAIVLRRADN